MSRICPGCPTYVPIVSRFLADGIGQRLRRLGEADPRGRTRTRLDVLGICLEWLGEPHKGLRVTRGIVGREYTRREKDIIAVDLHAVEVLPCPFARGAICLLGGQCTEAEAIAETRGGPWGWLPALLALAIDPESLATLVKRGLVADAKIALVTRRHSFPIRTRGGLAVASSLPEIQQEAAGGSFSGPVSLQPH